MPRTITTCPTCHARAVLHRPTTDCACLVCIVCAEKFLKQGQCGLCGVLFLDDDDDPDAV